MACGVAVRLFRALLFDERTCERAWNAASTPWWKAHATRRAHAVSRRDGGDADPNYREGSTSPALVETGDGERFVLKFAGAGPGPRALVIEFLATKLAGALGLRVPLV